MEQRTELKNYVMAGYPAIILTTPEEDRALTECKKIAESLNLEYSQWSLTKGFVNGNSSKGSGCQDPVKVLEDGVKTYSGKGKIFCVLDFHPYVKSANVWRTAKDVFKEAKTKGVTYIFISAAFEVPPELEREVMKTTLPLPTREDILKLLRNMAMQNKINIPEEEEYNVVEAALGLTINEAENAFATTISKYSKFDVKTIAKVKEQIICNGGLLEYKSSNESLETIGGMKNFTSWAMKRLSAYSPKAQEYGLPYPRGVLLTGIPGTGKSLSAKALANMWQKPLLRLDIGKLFGSLVGDTETNTRRALETAEAMAPAILWIDEIEKGLSGLQSSGKTDSGVISRLFGTILTWLQEKKAPVFVIATANNISQLPPEFLRKGRFDEIFFVDLPDSNERNDIFKIQLKKYKRNPENYEIDRLVEITDGFTGAEIEESVISAMYTAWNDGQRETTTEDVLKAIFDINPMSKGMMKQQVDELRDWSIRASIAKANGTMDSSSSDSEVRVIRT